MISAYLGGQSPVGIAAGSPTWRLLLVLPIGGEEILRLG
jgi:hypothetical protein